MNAERHRPSVPELPLIVLISLGAILSGCTGESERNESRRVKPTGIDSTATPTGNGVEAITGMPHDEIEEQLKEYFENHSMRVRSSDGNTIRTEPTALTSSNQLTGKSAATVRMAARIRLSDVGTVVTVVADRRLPAVGEWYRITASGNQRILGDVRNFLEQIFDEGSVSYTDTDFAYSNAEAYVGDNVIVVTLEDFETTEEATNYIAQSLSRLGYGVDQISPEQGLVQTEKKDIETQSSYETIRLKVSVLDPSTAEVKGEHRRPLPPPNRWNRISYKRVVPVPGVPMSWKSMLESAQEIGSIEDFRSE